METQTTYRQTHQNIIMDKQAYKQHHFHDFSIITSDKYMDEEYTQIMFADYYKNARQTNKPGHENRFVAFMINFYPERTRVIMERAGCTPKEIDDAYVIWPYELYNTKGPLKME
eukprot:6135235-Amphidinium_carterae.4